MIPDWLLAGGQGLLNLFQQNEARELNQQALADSIGLQSMLYGQTMGVSPSYLSGMLGYGFDPSLSAQGQSAFTSPQGAPGTGDGGFLGLGLNDGYQRDIFGRVVGGQPNQPSPASQSANTDAALDQRIRARPGGDGQPFFHSLPALAQETGRGFWDRAYAGQQGMDDLLSSTQAGFQGGVNDLGGMYGGAIGQAGQGYDALAGQIAGQGQGLLSQLQGGYRDRYNRNMSRIANLGAAEEQRIRDDYFDLGASQEAQLAQRGLGSSTISNTLGQGRQREMTRDLGDLSERLRREMTGYDMALSGDLLNSLSGQGNLNIGRAADLGLAGLGATTGLTSQGLGAQGDLMSQGLLTQADLGRFGLGFGAGLTGDALMNNYGFGQDVIDFNTGLIGGMVNTLQGVNYPYPQGGPLDPWMNIRAANNAQPDSPSFLDALAPGFGSALGTAATLPFLGIG